MYLNNNCDTIDSNENNEDSIKPVLKKIKNKIKTASDLHLSFELFKQRLNDSEKNKKGNMAGEDTNEQLHNNEDPLKEVSIDIKLIWLQSALNFIKNDHQVILKFPTISLKETDFIEAILNRDCEPGLDSRFDVLYLSIREALTIYKPKYYFALNTVFKNETTIKLELEKIPKNNKLKITKMPTKNNDTKLSAKVLKKQTKLINDKMKIMNGVSMEYIIDSYKKILNFLDDDLHFTIAFDKLTRLEYEFMMNVKQIVKHRELFASELPEELNLLLECISTHKDYSFNFLPSKPKYGNKYIIIMKMPKGGVRSSFRQAGNSLNTPRRFYNYPDTKDSEKQQKNNNKILYRKIDNTIKNTNESNDSKLDNNCLQEKQIGKEVNNNLFKTNNPYPIQTKSGCMMRRANSLTSCYVDNKTRSSIDLKESDSCENVNVSYWVQHNAAEYVTIDNEKKLPNQSKGIQFERGGSVDKLHEESSNKKNVKKDRGRSWSRDRDNQMKSKMYEALSIPLTSTKAMRMMQLMGWNGGALGSRGDGIIEPIMPALGIKTGAGLGHGRNNFKSNVKPKKEPQPVIQPENINNIPNIPIQSEKMPNILNPDKIPNTKNVKTSKKAKKSRQNYTVIEGEETRLKILTKILEFIKSSESKMVLCFDEVLQEEDTRFVICSIDRFNRRKYVRNLKSQYGADDLRKVQEAMLAKPHVNLVAKITEDKKDILLTKLFKGENNNDIGEDFALESNDSIRLSVSVFRYVKSMKPKETYGIFTKPSYQLLGYKLSILEQILKFLDKKESTLLLYIDIVLQDRHTDFLQNFVDVINMGRKPRYATEVEELLVEKIFNKIGDYCFILDFFKPLKIIKLQKRNRNTQYSDTCETKNLENELKQTEVKNVLNEKQNNDNLNKINSLEFNIEKTVVQITTNIMNNLSKMYENSVNNAEDTSATPKSAQALKESIISNNLSNTNINEIKNEQNEDIITIDLTKEENATREEPIQYNNAPEIKEFAKKNVEDDIKIEGKDVEANKDLENNIEIKEKDFEENKQLEKNIEIEEKDFEENKQLEKNIEIKEEDFEENKQLEKNIEIEEKDFEENKQLENNIEIKEKDFEENKQLEKNIEIEEEDNIEVTIEEYLSESDDLLQIIDDLEHSIKIEDNALDEELNHKRNRSYSNDSQLQNTKKIKRHSIKCYKQIQIIPNNYIETMNINLAGIVQSLISTAIDNTDCLPLLQCNGIVDDKLLYICYNENTYTWLKTVLSDQFEVLDMEEHFEGRRKLKINLKTYIYDDTTKILNRIKLYNNYLDVGNWKICKAFVSVDSTLLWVEVDEEDYNFISRNDFSLFAGIDKAIFSVTWD